VGSIDPEGIEKVWITNIRRMNVNPTTSTRMIAHSINQRPTEPDLRGWAPDVVVDVPEDSVVTIGGP